MVDITTHIKAEIFEIIVDGDIDASSSIHLDNAIEEAFGSSTKIVVNLEKLNYISSAGLGVFISRLEEIKQKNLKMVLFGLNQKVAQVFAILGLQQLMTITNDREAALHIIA